MRHRQKRTNRLIDQDTKADTNKLAFLGISERGLPVFVNETELAEWLQIAPGTLRNWRVSGNGPRYCKVSGNIVRYPMASVVAWLSDRHVSSTSEASA